MYYNYGKKMFTRKAKPIQINDNSDNQRPDKRSSTIPLIQSFIKIRQKFSAETCKDGMTLSPLQYSIIPDHSAREKNSPKTRCLAISNFLHAYWFRDYYAHWATIMTSNKPKMSKYRNIGKRKYNFDSQEIWNN